MALDNSQLAIFKSILRKASEELKSKELVFTSEWLFVLPTQSLEISNQMLHQNYDIPTGWDGYGENDLKKLVESGFLNIISESAIDPVTLEKTIKYRIME